MTPACLLGIRASSRRCRRRATRASHVETSASYGGDVGREVRQPKRQSAGWQTCCLKAPRSTRSSSSSKRLGLRQTRRFRRSKPCCAHRSSRRHRPKVQLAQRLAAAAELHLQVTEDGGFVPRHNQLTAERFYSTWLRHHQPVVLEGFAQHWPAGVGRLKASLRRSATNRSRCCRGARRQTTRTVTTVSSGTR